MDDEFTDEGELYDVFKHEVVDSNDGKQCLVYVRRLE